MFFWFNKSDQNYENEIQLKKEPKFNEDLGKKLLNDIKNEFGLSFNRKVPIALKKIEIFAIKQDIYSYEDLMNKIKEDRSIKDRLINLLTVGETYFFRELEQIKVLCEKISLNEVNTILCAPCSTGEEVYSILLYLEKNYEIPSSLKILGIDINSDSLQQAKKGVFSKRSVLKLPSDILNSRFILKDKNYFIDDALKKYTSFIYLNVFDEKFKNLGKFDALFSRNMLIYFDDEDKKRALKQFTYVTKKGSYLFLGHADVSFDIESFKYIQEKNTFYYRKDSV